MIKALLLSGFSLLLLSNSDCGKKGGSGKTYRGRLEVAGICMNYTIAFTGDSPDSSLFNAEWTDEVTGKQYENVFRLGNPCDFPPTIKAGDSFDFVIDTAKGKECMVCLAYYPTPSRAVSIKVVK